MLRNMNGVDFIYKPQAFIVELQFFLRHFFIAW
jgi:hypothetical protein